MSGNVGIFILKYSGVRELIYDHQIPGINRLRTWREYS